MSGKRKNSLLEAVNYLGGLTPAARCLKITRANLWYKIHKRKGELSIPFCKQIEKITNGKFPIKKLRPDIVKYLN